TTQYNTQGVTPPPGSNPTPAKMTFFVTSVGIGKGGDVGGLAGADAHCQALATAVGAGGHTWHAYLSTQARPGQPAVNARDRIGKGPWFNWSYAQLGAPQNALIAVDLADLHGDPLLLEFVERHTGLQPGRSGKHRRHRPFLLLRNQLISNRQTAGR